MVHKLLHWVIALLVLTSMALVAGETPAAAQSEPSGQTISNLNVRSGPGGEYGVLTVLPRGIVVMIEGRNRFGDWVLVHTPTHDIRGWVVSRYLIMRNVALANLQVIEGVTVPTEEESTAEVRDPGTLVIETDPETLQARLRAVPIVPTGFSHRVYEIFERGRQLGRRPNVFSTVGDCHTAHTGFLMPLGTGQYDLGPYGHLQETINFFSVSPRPEVGIANCFVNDSMAALNGFNSATVLAPVYADPAHCLPNESPLECEYRLVQPAVAIIMFGTAEVQVSQPDVFAWDMQNIVWYTIDQGIIPILNTFPGSPAFRWFETLTYNGVVLEIAAREQVPVINFFQATQALPNYGMAEDNFHLSYREDDRTVSFNGDENRWAFTLRNLVTLQTLDELRRQVLTR